MFSYGKKNRNPERIRRITPRNTYGGMLEGKLQRVDGLEHPFTGLEGRHFKSSAMAITNVRLTIDRRWI